LSFRGAAKRRPGMTMVEPLNPPLTIIAAV
jgi:hypothetical protein